MLICRCWLMDWLICHVVYDLSSFYFFVFGWSVERLINDSGSCVFLFILFEISGIWNKKMLFLHLLSLWLVGAVLRVWILSWNLGNSGHRSPTYLTNFYYWLSYGGKEIGMGNQWQKTFSLFIRCGHNKVLGF